MNRFFKNGLKILRIQELGLQIPTTRRPALD